MFKYKNYRDQTTTKNTYRTYSVDVIATVTVTTIPKMNINNKYKIKMLSSCRNTQSKCLNKSAIINNSAQFNDEKMLLRNLILQRQEIVQGQVLRIKQELVKNKNTEIFKINLKFQVIIRINFKINKKINHQKKINKVNKHY